MMQLVGGCPTPTSYPFTVSRMNYLVTAHCRREGGMPNEREKLGLHASDVIKNHTHRHARTHTHDAHKIHVDACVCYYCNLLYEAFINFSFL